MSCISLLSTASTSRKNKSKVKGYQKNITNVDHNPLAFGKNIKTNQFYLQENVVFLNHGSFGTVPKDVMSELHRIEQEHEENPDAWERLKYNNYLDLSLMTLANFVGAEKEDLFFVESPVRGIKRVFAAIDVDSGDEILLNNWTVHGVKRVVNTVCKIFPGVHSTTLVHNTPIQDTREILQQYESALEFHSKVKVVIVDHISSAPSIRFPVEELTKLCSSRGVTVIINGAHSPGHVPLNLMELGADFYVGNLSKWCFAPAGCGFLWAHPRHRHLIEPLRKLFRKEDDVTNNQFIMAKAAIQFFNSIGGFDKVSRYNSRLLDDATAMLTSSWGTSQLEVPKTMEPPFIRCVRLPRMEFIPLSQEGATKVFKTLWHKFKIWAPVFLLDDAFWVRVSAHVYCVADDYVKLKDAVIKLQGVSEPEMDQYSHIDMNQGHLQAP